MDNSEKIYDVNQMTADEASIQRSKELFEYEMTQVKLMLAGKYKKVSSEDMNYAGDVDVQTVNVEYTPAEISVGEEISDLPEISIVNCQDLGICAASVDGFSDDLQISTRGISNPAGIGEINMDICVSADVDELSALTVNTSCAAVDSLRVSLPDETSKVFAVPPLSVDSADVTVSLDVPVDPHVGTIDTNIPKIEADAGIANIEQKRLTGAIPKLEVSVDDVSITSKHLDSEIPRVTVGAECADISPKKLEAKIPTVEVGTQGVRIERKMVKAEIGKVDVEINETIEAAPDGVSLPSEIGAKITTPDVSVKANGCDGLASEVRLIGNIDKIENSVCIETANIDRNMQIPHINTEDSDDIRFDIPLCDVPDINYSAANLEECDVNIPVEFSENAIPHTKSDVSEEGIAGIGEIKPCGVLKHKFPEVDITVSAEVPECRMSSRTEKKEITVDLKTVDPIPSSRFVKSEIEIPEAKIPSRLLGDTKLPEMLTVAALSHSDIHVDAMSVPKTMPAFGTIGFGVNIALGKAEPMKLDVIVPTSLSGIKAQSVKMSEINMPEADGISSVLEKTRRVLGSVKVPKPLSYEEMCEMVDIPEVKIDYIRDFGRIREMLHAELNAST